MGADGSERAGPRSSVGAATRGLRAAFRACGRRRALDGTAKRGGAPVPGFRGERGHERHERESHCEDGPRSRSAAFVSHRASGCPDARELHAPEPGRRQAPPPIPLRPYPSGTHHPRLDTVARCCNPRCMAKVEHVARKVEHALSGTASVTTQPLKRGWRRQRGLGAWRGAAACGPTTPTARRSSSRALGARRAPWRRSRRGGAAPARSRARAPRRRSR